MQHPLQGKDYGNICKGLKVPQLQQVLATNLAWGEWLERRGEELVICVVPKVYEIFHLALKNHQDRAVVDTILEGPLVQSACFHLNINVLSMFGTRGILLG